MRSEPQLCFLNLALNTYLDIIRKFNFAHTIASKNPDLVFLTKTSSNERWKPRYRSVAMKSLYFFD